MGNLRNTEDLQKQSQTGMQDKENAKTGIPLLFPIFSFVQRCVKVFSHILSYLWT